MHKETVNLGDIWWNLKYEANYIILDILNYHVKMMHVEGEPHVDSFLVPLDELERFYKKIS